jgi:DNA segregation ATPase FtsK/SpoIIIE-like protein
MQIPITLGRHSEGTGFSIDLEELPHLFISYSEEEQLYQIFYSIIATLAKDNEPAQLQFAFALPHETSTHIFPLLSEKHIYSNYISNEPEEKLRLGKNAFIAALMKELKIRNIIFENNIVTNIADYNNKQMVNQKKKQIPNVLLVADNIIDLMIGIEKSNGMHLLNC